MSWRYKYYKKKPKKKTSHTGFDFDKTTSKYYNKFRSRINPKYFFSEKEIDFSTERLNYSQFLLQEFFSKDLEEQEDLIKFYSSKFGNGSLSYLRRKYSEWKEGDFHLTDLMRERIIEIMPNFLNEEARHNLGRYEFMTLIKTTVKSHLDGQKRGYKYGSKFDNAREIVDLFEGLVDKIENVNPSVVGYLVLSIEEKNEAIEISKYILAAKLQMAFEQIKRDFEIFTPFVDEIGIGLVSVSYTIKSLNIELDLTKLNADEIEIPEYKIVEVEGNNQFQIYSDKYLAYELLNIHTDRNKAIVNSFLNTTDISIFLNHYEELLKSDSESEVKSIFHGEGGNLSLKIQIVPPKALKNSIAFSISKLIILTILITGIIYWLIETRSWVFLILGLLIFGNIIISIFKERLKYLNNSFKNLNQLGNYGK